MKVKMQIIFKTGNSLQGETNPNNFDAFVQRFMDAKEKCSTGDGKSYFEIRDFEDGKSHSIMIDLRDVNAMVFEQIAEDIEAKMTPEEIHNLDVVGNRE